MLILLEAAGGSRRPVYYYTTRQDTVFLRRLLAMLVIDPNLYVIVHSPISVAAYHGRVNTVPCLLSIESV
jgi:hypothetical protein